MEGKNYADKFLKEVEKVYKSRRPWSDVSGYINFCSITSGPMYQAMLREYLKILDLK